MGMKQYIKRGLKFVLHGVPERKVYAQVSYLAPNEMLRGRTALITGGTSGIGYEIAKAYINAGARVVITGRNEEKVKKACETINKEVAHEGNVFGIAMDNTDVKSMPSKLQDIDFLISEGHIDILVNNAGVVGGEISNCTEELYDTILDTNLKGTFSFPNWWLVTL